MCTVRIIEICRGNIKKIASRTISATFARVFAGFALHVALSAKFIVYILVLVGSAGLTADFLRVYHEIFCAFIAGDIIRAFQAVFAAFLAGVSIVEIAFFAFIHAHSQIEEKALTAPRTHNFPATAIEKTLRTALRAAIAVVFIENVVVLFRTAGITREIIHQDEVLLTFHALLFEIRQVQRALLARFQAARHARVIIIEGFLRTLRVATPFISLIAPRTPDADSLLNALIAEIRASSARRLRTATVFQLAAEASLNSAVDVAAVSIYQVPVVAILAVFGPNPVSADRETLSLVFFR